MTQETGAERAAGTADRLYKTEAIILKQLPTGEADRLLTFYTPYLGKLRAIARGARRPKSKLVGHVEPLVHVQLLVARGRNLDVVSQAETLEPFVAMRSSLEATSRGLYCAELMDAFAPDGYANPQLFGLLLATLGRLNTGETEVALRWFELRLLHLTGFRPELHQCAQCGNALAMEACGFSPEAGGALCSGCRGSAAVQAGALVPTRMSLNALKSLRYLQANDYQEARRLRLPMPLALELEGLLRFYIRHVLERDVRSTAFLDHLRRVRGREG